MKPWLVIAVGNPSRGDDALGPTLIDRLHAHHLREVELLTDFQLQVEHALDLQDRRGVLFIDAAHPGRADEPVQLRPLAPDAGPPVGSHALRPEAVLQVAGRVLKRVPPAWLLAIEGVSFGLGEGLSEAARQRLVDAEQRVLVWLHERRSALTHEVDHA